MNALSRSFSAVCPVLGLALCVTLVSTAFVTAQPTLPTAEMQQLVSDIELQLQLTYRGEARTYNQRRGELQAALEAWNKSRRTDADLAVMQAWLQKALRASLPGVGGGMPAPPEFAAPQEVATLPPPQPESVIDSLPAPSSVPDSSEPVTQPAPAERVAKTPALETPDDEEIESVIERPAPRVEQPRSAIADVATPDESPLEQPEPEPVAPEPPVLLTLDQHPAAAELEWDNPFVDDPAKTLEEELPSRRTAGFRPAEESSSEESLQVRINLSELSARIRGYSQGLDVIEGELVRDPDATGFQLAGLTRELESLHSQRELIEMYFARLSEIERMAMEDLPSPNSVIQLLATRAKSRQEAVTKSRSRAPAVVAERAVLDGLQMKLQELGGESEES